MYDFVLMTWWLIYLMKAPLSKNGLRYVDGLHVACGSSGAKIVDQTGWGVILKYEPLQRQQPSDISIQDSAYKIQKSLL